MTQMDETADAAARLEQALERIARVAVRRDIPAVHAPGAEQDMLLLGVWRRAEALYAYVTVAYVTVGCARAEGEYLRIAA